MHRDHVPVESFANQFTSGDLRLVGSTGPTKNQGVIKFYPLPPDSKEEVVRTHRDIQVLTLQGHPEFSESIVTGIIRQRIDGMGTATVTDYWGQKGGDYDDEPKDKTDTGRRWRKTDGLDIVSQALWKILGVTPLAGAYDESKEKEGITRMSKTAESGVIAKVQPTNKATSWSWGWRLTDGLNLVSNLLRKMFSMTSWW